MAGRRRSDLEMREMQAGRYMDDVPDWDRMEYIPEVEIVDRRQRNAYEVLNRLSDAGRVNGGYVGEGAHRAGRAVYDAGASVIEGAHRARRAGRAAYDAGAIESVRSAVGAVRNNRRGRVLRDDEGNEIIRPFQEDPMVLVPLAMLAGYGAYRGVKAIRNRNKKKILPGVPTPKHLPQSKPKPKATMKVVKK